MSHSRMYGKHKKEMMPLLSGDPFAIADDEPYLSPVKAYRKAQERERWFVEIQGSCTKFKMCGGKTPEPPDRLGTDIGPFSKASRLRLLSYMNKVNWEECPMPIFVTLTYPDSIEHRDYAVRSRDRYLFLRYVEKHLKKKTPCLWRVEWKPRKSGKNIGKLMPHWHLLFFSLNALQEKLVREWWRKSIGHDETYLDVDVRNVTGELGAVKYLAKYVSKQSALGIIAYRNSGFRFGRHWGITRKALIPLAPIAVKRQLTDDEIVAARQYASGIWTHYDAIDGKGFTLLDPKLAKEWKEFLD